MHSIDDMEDLLGEIESLDLEEDYDTAELEVLLGRLAVLLDRHDLEGRPHGDPPYLPDEIESLIKEIKYLGGRPGALQELTLSVDGYVGELREWIAQRPEGQRELDM
jgi:hypothetical protein